MNPVCFLVAIGIYQSNLQIPILASWIQDAGFASAIVVEAFDAPHVAYFVKSFVALDGLSLFVGVHAFFFINSSRDSPGITCKD